MTLPFTESRALAGAFILWHSLHFLELNKASPLPAANEQEAKTNAAVNAVKPKKFFILTPRRLKYLVLFLMKRLPRFYRDLRVEPSLDFFHHPAAFLQE